MTVMGRTLWDSGLGFEDIAEDYFAAAYGADGPACREYLAKLSELFDPPFVRGEKEGTEAIAQSLGKVQGVIDASSSGTLDRTIRATRGRGTT